MDCRSTTALSNYSEMVQLKFTLTTQRGRLTGASVSWDPAGTKGGIAAGTCRWTYTLMSGNDPGVPGCP